MKNKVGVEPFLWAFLLMMGIVEFEMDMVTMGFCGLASYVARRRGSSLSGWTFFWLWLVMIAFEQVQIDVAAVGLLGVGYCLINAGRTRKKKKAKARLSEKQVAITENLNHYFEEHSELRISEHVSLARQRPLKTYMEAIVYYDGELVGSLKEFKNSEHFSETYAALEDHITSLRNYNDFVDENKNGIDDREEIEANARYFGERIESYMPWFQSPNITAGLRAVSQQLYDVQTIVDKYPQCEPKLRKLNSQYLPLLMAILDQYQGLKEKRANQDELSVIEVKLEKTLILISEAIKNLMASFASEDLVSVSADMTVLEAILKRDGLVKEGVMGVKS